MKHLVSVLLIAGTAVLGRAEGLLGVATADGNTVWAVGPSGLVLRSLDGGASWGSLLLDTLTLRDVAAQGSGVWIAGNGGTLHRSTDGGGSWSSAVIAPGQAVHALAFRSASHGWAAGAAGMMLATTDGGVTWTPQTSGTAATITSLWFADSLRGYAAGTGGTLRATTDGGSTWTDAAGAGWAADLAAVRGAAGALYVAGAGGFARRSTDGGLSWTVLPTSTESRSDVTALHVFSPDTAVFALGGGALWGTSTGGSAFTWGLHQMHAPVSDVTFHDPLRGWAVSGGNNAVLRTTDGGASWSLPPGTTVSYSWSRRLVENSSIGNTFVIAPWNTDFIYVALGDSIYRSTDVGETWSYRARITPGPGNTHSFYISPKDSNLWVVAHTGGGDAVKRSTNAGVTWTTTLQRNFTSYGMPLEMDPNHPDTLLFAVDGTGSGGSDANGILYISTDFGLTWDTLAATNFRSPCDVVIVPDSNGLVYVGDGITGSGRGKFWRSENGGETWALIDSVTGSEIPTVTMCRLRRNEAFHTAWGSGGVRKTGDFAKTWTQVATTSSAWGIDVARDDPNAVMFGVYGGGISYLSTNGGAAFPAGQQASLSGSNYAILGYDRATFLAQQSGGVYKMRVTYTVPVSNAQALSLTAPNGGEAWTYGTVRNVTWNSSNVSAVKIEYSTTPGGPWQTVTASAPATPGLFQWTIPDAPTASARIRISDTGDGSPIDSSDGVFTIAVPAIALAPATLTFDSTESGTTRSDTVRITNAGTAPLVITAVTGSGGLFTPGRSSFTIPAGSSDTLSILYAPVSAGTDRDTLSILNSSPDSPALLVVEGTGVVTGPLTVGIPMEAGWNMISLPVLPGDPRTIAVFPGASSGAFAYSGSSGYLPQDTLEGGRGYWLKFDSTFTAPVTGTPLAAETVDVSAGWNMIGAVLAPVDTEDVIQDPDGIISSSYFGYAAGYTASPQLLPGRAYWVKADAPGRLFIGPPGLRRSRASVPAQEDTR